MKWLFDVFSRRPISQNIRPEEVTPEFRNRVMLLCRDTFSKDFSGSYLKEFFEQIHVRLQYLHGSPVLCPQEAPTDATQDLLYFLQVCSSDHFLDFLEYLFQVDVFWRFDGQAKELVESINSFFLIDDLPYHLTDYVQVREAKDHGTTIRVSAYPKVVLKEYQLVHQNITAPALDLLTDPAYASANREFLEALEDYRKGDIGDCLTKCGSALESTLKVICDQKNWSYSQTDSVSRLLKKVIAQPDLPGFLEQPLMLVATIRNRLSKSHGAGVEDKEVTPQLARYALNITASSMLLLVEEVR